MYCLLKHNIALCVKPYCRHSTLLFSFLLTFFLDTPWVKLLDAESQCYYFYHRLSGESEWVDGTSEQVRSSDGEGGGYGFFGELRR